MFRYLIINEWYIPTGQCSTATDQTGGRRAIWSESTDQTPGHTDNLAPTEDLLSSVVTKTKHWLETSKRGRIKVSIIIQCKPAKQIRGAVCFINIKPI